MKSTQNNVIGVGTWVEMRGRWWRLDPHDPWSWFMFPWLTLRKMLDSK